MTATPPTPPVPPAPSDPPAPSGPPTPPAPSDPPAPPAPSGPEIVRLEAARFASYADDLGALLADTVNGGSSLGFFGGLTPSAATAWWRDRTPAVERGDLTVWAALDETTGRCVGTISLARSDKATGRHRAEITKLMVHDSARGRGLARALLAAVEETAAEEDIFLLVLDTETGSPAEALYRGAGWTQAGVIPDYAADPAGTLRPTTVFYKHPRQPIQPDTAGRRAGRTAGRRDGRAGTG